jgi:hypothetical protein
MPRTIICMYGVLCEVRSIATMYFAGLKTETETGTGTGGYSSYSIHQQSDPKYSQSLDIVDHLDVGNHDRHLANWYDTDGQQAEETILWLKS